jgi:hypothetical protein
MHSIDYMKVSATIVVRSQIPLLLLGSSVCWLYYIPLLYHPWYRDDARANLIERYFKKLQNHRAPPGISGSERGYMHNWNCTPQEDPRTMNTMGDQTVMPTTHHR